MLSSDLDSARAVAINIEIMRTFVNVRGMAATHQELAKRLSKLGEKTKRLVMQHETCSRNTRIELKQVFDARRELTASPELPKRPMGFVTHEKNAALAPLRDVEAAKGLRTVLRL